MTKQTNTSNCDHTWGDKLADGTPCCIKCNEPKPKITPKQIEEALRKKFPGLGDRLIVI